MHSASRSAPAVDSERVARFVERRVLTALGAPPGASFVLEVPPGARRSVIHRLRLADGRTAFVRADRIAHKLYKRVRGQRHLRRRGFAAPRVLLAALDPWTRLRYGFWFSVEEARPGTDLAALAARGGAAAEDAARAVGRALAAVHGVTSHWRGHVAELRFPCRDLEGLLRRRVARWVERAKAPCGEHLGAALRILAEAPRAAWRQAPRLGLGDCALGNFLVDGGAVSFVDLTGVKYGSAPLEAEDVRRRLREVDAALPAAFDAGYREAANAPLLAETEAARDLVAVIDAVRASSPSRLAALAGAAGTGVPPASAPG